MLIIPNTGCCVPAGVGGAAAAGGGLSDFRIPVGKVVLNVR